MTTRKRQATPVDHRLAKALSHPLRAHVLGILNERVASPVELARELEEPLGVVSYHVRTLAELGCIELVRTEPRRGALEHYYRAMVRPFFSDQDWKRLPKSARHGISGVALQMIWEDLGSSLDQGVFDARADRHLSRSPLVLDQQGWLELNAELASMLRKAQDIAVSSAQRLAESSEQGVSTKLVMMHFESALPEKRRSARRTGRRDGRADSRRAPASDRG